jgi:hypothetical protein
MGVLPPATVSDEWDREIDEAARSAWRALLDLPEIADKLEAVERLRVLLAQEERSWLPEAEQRN